MSDFKDFVNACHYEGTSLCTIEREDGESGVTGLFMTRGYFMFKNAPFRNKPFYHVFFDGCHVLSTTVYAHAESTYTNPRIRPRREQNGR